METAVRHRVSKLIKDQELFREACYIDGRWISSRRRRRFPSTIRRRARSSDTFQSLAGRRRRTAIAAAAARVSRLARPHGERAGRAPAQMVRVDDGEPGGSRASDDARAGEAAHRITRRSRLRRRRSSNGSPKKRNGPTATPSRPTPATSASSSSRNRLAWSAASRRGISRLR